MAPSNAHLLAHFRDSASEETFSLAEKYLLKSQTTMKGSIGNLSPGLPAACILLASQRLKNSDFDEKTAQRQSSLNLKDFRKLYNIIKSALEDQERSSCITYDELYDTYNNLKLWKDEFDPYISEVERAMESSLVEESNTTFFRCMVFFWLWGIVSPDGIADARVYASNHHIQSKMMVNLIHRFNETSSSSELRNKIQNHVNLEKVRAQEAKSSEASTKEGNANVANAKATFTPSSIETNAVRQTRLKVSTDIAPHASTPPARHATTVAQLPAPSRNIWEKPQKRKMPTKSTPNKAAPIDSSMDVNEERATTSKKRRISPPNSAIPAPTTSSRVLRTPVKKPAQILPPVIPRTTSPKKPPAIPVSDRVQLLATYKNEPVKDKRRFRPIYLEHKLWLARDPRLLSP